MIGRLLRRDTCGAYELVNSKLFNQSTFYPAFARDLGACSREVVIESPFLTMRRTSVLLPLFRMLKSRAVRVVINTRDPREQDGLMRSEAERSLNALRNLGVIILLTGGHHRKLAILDRRVLWEGSLNILSQGDSCEVMRRIESASLAEQMVAFTKLAKFLT